MSKLPEAQGSLLLLHNPKCSKSRATHALLEERGASFEVRLYLEDPLNADELAELGRRLGKPVGAWTRTRQDEYEAAGLSGESDDSAVYAAMAASPILMERPVLVGADRAIIGRPPEDVLELL